MPPVIVRPFLPCDRQGVRDLACDTADRGAPVEGLFHDRDVFADLLTRYYTDVEPQALWVAEQDGGFAGYLTGCLDGRGYARQMRARIVPGAVLKALARGALWAPPAWRWVGAAWRTWRLGGFRRLNADLARYPAHLHLNVRSGCRGQGVGSQLLNYFLEQARQAQLPGIHASVRRDNPEACRFFTRMGFVELGGRPVVFPHGAQYHAHETVLYGKTC